MQKRFLRTACLYIIPDFQKSPALAVPPERRNSLKGGSDSKSTILIQLLSASNKVTQTTGKTAKSVFG